MRRFRLALVLLPVVAGSRSLADTLSTIPLSCLYDTAGRPLLGFYGPYNMTREASGTAWQPEATPHDGIHWTGGDWDYMLHGFANVGYDNQGGHRGDTQGFTTNMLMFSGERSYESDAIGFRTAASLEPLMGPNGYPELLQTGETANGISPLVDRQHPHDLFDELALTENHQLTENSSVFVYGGLPGEPALGPVAFMHRLSGEDNPVAPISHHWMDSTHITYGVITTGYIWNAFKLEGSSFRGRESDQDHWNIEPPKLDSYSGRLSYNPTANWSSQMSWGHLTSPEELFPKDNVNRGTASVGYTRAWQDGWSATTAVWGRNWNEGIDTLDAFLLESAVNVHNTHTVFTRYEYVQKDDLLPAVPLFTISPAPRIIDYHPFFPGGNAVFTINTYYVSEFTVGYIYDFPSQGVLKWGVGTSGTVSIVPDILKPFYGNDPLSFIAFIRLKVGRGSGYTAGQPKIKTPFDMI